MYRLLVENVTDYAILMLSPEGRVATWTEGAERMMGCLTLDGVFGNPASRSHVYGWRAEEMGSWR